MSVSGSFDVSGKEIGTDLVRFGRQQVGENGNDALAAEREDRHDLIVVAGIDVERVAAVTADFGDRTDAAACFFDGADFLMLGKLRTGFRLYVDARARGNILQNDGFIHGVGHGKEVLDEAALGGFVVVRRDLKQCVRTDLTGIFGKGNGIIGVVAACAGNDRNAAGDLFNTKADELFVFLVGKRARFAGRTADDNSVNAVLDLKFHQTCEFLEINAAVFHRRDNSGGSSRENCVFHDDFSFDDKELGVIQTKKPIVQSAIKCINLTERRIGRCILIAQHRTHPVTVAKLLTLRPAFGDKPTLRRFFLSHKPLRFVLRS